MYVYVYMPLPLHSLKKILFWVGGPVFFDHPYNYRPLVEILFDIDTLCSPPQTYPPT